MSTLFSLPSICVKVHETNFKFKIKVFLDHFMARVKTKFNRDSEGRNCKRVNQKRWVLGKLMGTQHIHEAMVDEVKGFPILLLPPSLQNTTFQGIQQKEQKRDLI